MPAISVIMPVHNSGPYLKECLDSILAQTMEDWEVLCVDDGSTDDSATILDEYAGKDGRFRVFHNEHSNAGAARNFALEYASGEYLAFLDSDDIFSPWLFETLLDKAQMTDADVVTCKASWFSDGGKKPVFKEPTFWKDCTPDADWSNKPLASGTMPWNKLIRRSFVEDRKLRFLEQSSTNDLTFIGLALAMSRKTVSTGLKLVGYRQHGNSIQAKKEKTPLNGLRALTAFLEGLKSNGQWDKMSPAGHLAWFRFYTGVSLFELRSLTSFKGYRELYKGLIQNDRAQHLSEMFPPEEDENHLVRRYRAIIAGRPMERIRAFLEAVISPIRGNRKRSHGLTAWLNHLIDAIAMVATFLVRLFSKKKKGR